MYGIVDCDNCYVSCERVFRPDLEGKIVVVLSNNDGCVVARSNEAKALGIKEGTPYYQLAEQFPNQKIAVFSSNYELYGELTSRVVSIISQEAPAYFRYSIDECFIYLDGMENIDLQKWGENVQPSNFPVGYSDFDEDATDIEFISGEFSGWYGEYVSGSAKVTANDGKYITIQFSNYAFEVERKNSVHTFVLNGSLKFQAYLYQ